MTEKETNLCNKCTVCIGCGRCAGKLKGIQIVTESLCQEDKTAGAAKKARNLKGYMAAVDIGTTTIAMVLRKLSDGSQAARYVKVNPQRLYGADVISRIQAASDKGKREEMRRMAVQTLEEGITEFVALLRQKADEAGGRQKIIQAGAQNPEEEYTLHRICIAANTAMVYLLMGYDISELGAAPFTVSHPGEIHTHISGIPAVAVPCISAFVGGDITAGLMAVSMQEKESVSLFIDLGTNGELAIGNKDRILATATAAGPAFEGGNTAGLFGADMVDLTARALQEGLIDNTGLIREPYFEDGIVLGGVRITQRDVRQLQLAKAAVCAGIVTLAHRYGLTDLTRIDKVYLAGGFGCYLKPQAAEAIGLLPKQLAGRVESVGNTALAGAFDYGREWEADSRGREESKTAGSIIPELVSKTAFINLAGEEEFNRYYFACMTLKEIELEEIEYE